MNAVMLSIAPKWCELIASGKKTIEVRKTRPKIETPFKCYIYECNWKDNSYYVFRHKGKLGKVIGEFVCDNIVFFGNIGDCSWDRLLGNVHEYHKSLVVNQALLTEKDMLSYGGKYGLHISHLVIYDKPKELGEFQVHDKTYDHSYAWAFNEKNVPLKRPPQSWCYVEELSE